MLLAINERIKGWLGAVVIIFITLPFALWGIQEYIGGASEQYAAVIDDREISVRELERDVTLLRQQLARNEQQIPSEKALRQQAIDRIINTVILEQAALDQGYEISDQVLASSIQRLFSQDGNFDPERFKMIIASQGMTPQSFEQTYRGELRVDQLRNGIINSVIITDEDARKLIQLEKQKRDVTWLKLNVDKLASTVTASDEQIAAYYEENIVRFKTPAKVSVEYVELTADTIKDINIDESRIKSLYDEYVDQQNRREERRASHILASSAEDANAARAKIDELKLKLDDGADFADIAREFSDDTGSAQDGGDLDWVGLGQMVKPFEDALFALQQGEVSDVVETEFGYHIIKLDDVRKAETLPYEQKREELLARLKQEAADSLMYDLSEIMANTAYENPDSLEPVAQALDLEIKSSDLFTRTAGSGIADYADVRKAAFSAYVLEQGENSEMIEVEPGYVVVLRVKEHLESAPIPLDEVRLTIAEAIRVTEGQKIVNDIADQITEQLKQGNPVSSVVRDGVVDMGTRSVEATTGDLDRVLLSTIMSMPIPVNDEPVYESVNLGSGDVALIRLNKVEFPEDIDDSLLAVTKSRYKSRRALDEFGAVLTALKDKASIHINSKALNPE